MDNDKPIGSYIENIDWDKLTLEQIDIVKETYGYQRDVLYLTILERKCQ